MTGLLVPAGKVTVSFIFRIAVIVAQNAGSICVMNNVLAKEQFFLNDVPNEAAEKHNVASGADRHPDIGQRARAGEPWIDMDDRRAALFCFHYPAETDRV